MPNMGPGNSFCRNEGGTMSITQWQRTMSTLDHAFQPIVNIYTGACYGYEALLRNFEEAGFHTIQDVFDRAYADGVLAELENTLREKAITKLAHLPGDHKARIFYNVDNRLLAMPDHQPDVNQLILHEYRLYPDSICFEISERHQFHGYASMDKVISFCRSQAYKIAIDDFGTGFSGLQLLYHCEPDFIKIDRFFIAGIESDSKKKLFVAKVLNLAHILGIMVIAVGVETEREYYMCKEIGCDFIQGYLVQKPTRHIGELKNRYEMIEVLRSMDRREKIMDRQLISNQMEYLETVSLYTGDRAKFTELSSVFEAFRRHASATFFPVLNGNQEPIGIIRETELKSYVYSRYGRDLLLNRAMGKSIIDFVIKCPISEVNTRIERILESLTIDEHSEGILITENGRYAGFLSARALLKVIHDKNLAIARDQNPLTRLPGNTMINEFIEESLQEQSLALAFVYFDFDNFKPFNDRYGYRQGDRAIMLFADILREASNPSKFFIGHIGGDDFFAEVGEWKPVHCRGRGATDHR
jgi:EAL domain-containing protein (putative c-di-GMP-specific phosphodiesterase class I)/GGDEF domain-containing protein